MLYLNAKVVKIVFVKTFTQHINYDVSNALTYITCENLTYFT